MIHSYPRPFSSGPRHLEGDEGPRSLITPYSSGTGTPENEEEMAFLLRLEQMQARAEAGVPPEPETPTATPPEDDEPAAAPHEPDDDGATDGVPDGDEWEPSDDADLPAVDEAPRAALQPPGGESNVGTRAPQMPEQVPPPLANAPKAEQEHDAQDEAPQGAPGRRQMASPEAASQTQRPGKGAAAPWDRAAWFRERAARTGETELQPFERTRLLAEAIGDRNQNQLPPVSKPSGDRARHHWIGSLKGERKPAQQSPILGKTLERPRGMTFTGTRPPSPTQEEDKEIVEEACLAEVC